MHQPHSPPSTAARRARASRVGLSTAGAAIGGFVVGALMGGGWGALSGLALGILLARSYEAQREVESLAAQVARLEDDLTSFVAQAPQEEATGAATDIAPEQPRTRAEALPAPPSAPGEQPITAPEPPQTIVPSPPPDAPARTVRVPSPARSRRRDPVELAFARVRDFFFGGNTVVRVGVVVLLVGIALLAKWAADNALFPLEARLASAALIGLGLVATGYRLRETRPGFATTLQGGGIASLFLVIFSAYRVFELVPASMAFAGFVMIAASGGVLAVGQRSQPLIFIGALGGFAAPMVASTGSGNHVVLFTYYLVLNLAIAGVAFKQAWRPLNLLAFACTYGVATVWGILEYRSEDYASTQAFVIAYHVLFTLIAILHAHRQPPRLRGLVDGTLVFGTAIVTLLAQGRLLAESTLGLALSAAALGAFYAGLASFFWQRERERMRLLCEAFLALGVGFGTMAIPFALEDALTTSLAWALEGAGLYWVGSRQDRRLPRLSGVLLQALAAIAFFGALAVKEGASEPVVAVVNGRFLSCLALAGSSLFMAWRAHRDQSVGSDVPRGAIGGREARLSQGLIGWGLLWWAGGVIAELEDFLPDDIYMPAALVMGIALSAFALERGGHALRWLPARLSSLAAIPLAFLLLPAIMDQRQGLLEHGGVIAWPLCLGAIYFALQKLEGAAVPTVRLAHAPALWLLSTVVSLGMGAFAAETLGLGDDWAVSFALAGLGGTLLISFTLAERGLGAFARHTRFQLVAGAAPIIAVALVTGGFAALGNAGDLAPLPHLPLLNFLDAALAIIVLAAIRFNGRVAELAPEIMTGPLGRARVPAALAFGFLWINGVLARAVHHYADVRFDGGALWDSTPMQVALSITWSSVALAAMWLSTRRGWRLAWMGAATLLGVVVIKLFLVDLSQLGTGARILTFLVVGGLLLVVGYVSPVPPGEDESPRDPRGGAGPGGEDDVALAGAHGGGESR